MKTWKLVEKRLAQKLGSQRNGNLGRRESDFDAKGMSFEVKQRASWPKWFYAILLSATEKVIELHFEDTGEVYYLFNFTSLETERLPKTKKAVSISKKPGWFHKILEQAELNTKPRHHPMAVLHKRSAKSYFAVCPDETWMYLQHQYEGAHHASRGRKRRRRSKEEIC